MYEVDGSSIPTKYYISVRHGHIKIQQGVAMPCSIWFIFTGYKRRGREERLLYSCALMSCMAAEMGAGQIIDILYSCLRGVTVELLYIYLCK